MLYNNLLQKILNAYKKIDYRPNPRVYFDFDRKECNPLVAIVIAQFGLESFLKQDRFFNEVEAHRKVKKMFDWIWVEGFNDAFNVNEVKKSWNQYPVHAAGYKVGVEIRSQLRKIYYQKPNPS